MTHPTRQAMNIATTQATSSMLEKSYRKQQEELFQKFCQEVIAGKNPSINSNLPIDTKYLSFLSTEVLHALLQGLRDRYQTSLEYILQEIISSNSQVCFLHRSLSIEECEQVCKQSVWIQNLIDTISMLL